MMERADILRQLGEQGGPWDVLVIGGGASGLGAAVEAAARGYRTVLVERADFAKGTLEGCSDGRREFEEVAPANP